MNTHISTQRRYFLSRSGAVDDFAVGYGSSKRNLSYRSTQVKGSVLEDQPPCGWMICQGFLIERSGVGTSRFTTLHSKEEEEEGKHPYYPCVLRFGGGHRRCNGLELSRVCDFAGSGAHLSH